MNASPTRLARSRRHLLGALALLLVAATLAGCYTLNHRRSGRSSSVVTFLYPPGSEEVMTPRVPRLALPLQVGVAWVPAQSGDMDLTAVQQMALADEIRLAFESKPFVGRVVNVPPGYLRQRGGWTNLEQVGRMMNLDVIVLLGYDQVHIMESTVATWSILTIVGAYTIPSEGTGTHTLMEASVIDLGSRQLLFRAPGMHVSKRTFAPLAASDSRQRQQRDLGFTEAMVSLIGNLGSELNHFQEQIKTMPESVEIVHRPGYRGAGSLPLSWGASLLLGAGLIAGSRRNRSNANSPQEHQNVAASRS